jgi:hypothetical protein
MVLVRYGACFIITVFSHCYYNVAAATLFASLDSLAALSLANAGLVFSFVALIRVGSIAWQNMCQAVTRRWHFGSSVARNFSRRGC